MPKKIVDRAGFYINTFCSQGSSQIRKSKVEPGWNMPIKVVKTT